MYMVLYISLGLYGIVIAGLTRRLLSGLRRFKPVRLDEVNPADLPSVSVCVPARNETHALTSCLDRVLKSDYKKLEVIVYDDSSVDDTSLVIRSYAHAGVRFVPGPKLPEGWIGKNHALNVLAKESSGKFILFMDVDTDIKPTTISQLVQFVVKRDLKMASVIPRRRDGWRMSVIFGNLRYFWQLVLSSSRAPAAASALWVIERTRLIELGSLEAYKSSIAPEALFAAQNGSDYGCLMSDEQLGVGYEKKWTSQSETGRRLLYPTLGNYLGSPWAALAMLTSLNLPMLVLVVGLIIGEAQLVGLGLAAVIVGMLMYGIYTRLTWNRGWWLGALVWPVICLQETILFMSSLIGHTRQTITWKGRRITAPVLKVEYYKIDN